MIILNGELHEGPVLSDSILLGDGTFETLRSYEGKLFALTKHLDRLELGLRQISHSDLLPAGYERGAVCSAIEKSLKSESFKSGALRVSAYVDGSLVVSYKEYSPPSASIRCLTLRERSDGFHFKSSSYSMRLRARRYAESKGFDDAVFVGSGDEVSELSTSNLIALVDGQWVTPRLQSGALPGITRGELVSNFGVREVSLTRNELENAQALAAISSLREIQGIKEIDGKSTPNSDELRELKESFHSWILGNLAL
jgi:branched-chain amino acid aminotransferase